MPNKKLIAANWKMNKGLVQSQQFADELKKYFEKYKLTDTEVVLCPPFTSLDAVNKKIAGTPIKLGAQNMYFETIGAYTGEISAGMLKSCGCEYVILGHSERRQYFNETNAIINQSFFCWTNNKIKSSASITHSSGFNLRLFNPDNTPQEIDLKLIPGVQYRINKVSPEGECLETISGSKLNILPYKIQTLSIELE